MLSSIVIVLEQLYLLRMYYYFLILKMSVLCLNVVKLVSQSQVVFVSLLNFEDFSLKLRDE